MARLRPIKSVETNFRRVMPRLVRRYFRLGRRLVRSIPSNQELHQFRIRTKRIRYITEVYHELFPRAFGNALTVYRGIQQILGSLQDQVNLAAYFERRLMQVRTPGRQVEYLRLLHRARMRQQFLRQAFFRRWRRLERTAFEKRLLEGIKRT